MVEQLEFKIRLSASYWNKVPEYLISIVPRIELGVRQFSAATGANEDIEFAVGLEPGQYQLRVALLNKQDSDTVVENGVIVRDMRLNVERITVNGTRLPMIASSATYFLDSAREFQGQVIDHIPQAVNMGWNGYYQLPFAVPFYPWFIENL